MDASRPDDARRRQLRESLERALAAEIERRRMTPRERLDWLANHVQVYAGRVSSLAARADTSMKTLIASDLFTSVESAADAVRVELQRGDAPSPLSARWTPIEVALADVRRRGDREQAVDLRRMVVGWREALAAAMWAPPADLPRPATGRRSRA